MEKLKVGIIGAGGIAQYVHIPSYQKIEGVEVVAVSDINEEKLDYVAEKFKIPKKFKDWKDLLSEDIDIVSICSPNSFHAEQTICALNAGKNVMCEKPACLNLHQAEEIFRTVKKTGKKFMVAFNKRFLPEIKFLKKLIENGEFGEIYYVKTSYLRRRGIPGLGSWFTTKKLAGGGPMFDIGVHIVDLAIYLMGGPMPELVVGAYYDKFKDKATDGGWPPIESRIGDKKTGIFDVEDFACGYVKLSNGATLFVEASWAGNCQPGIKTIIMGTKAGAEIPDPLNPQNPLRIYSEINGTLTDITPSLPKTSPNFSYEEEIKHFIECIREDKEPITKEREIISVIKIIEGIYKSAETGQAIKY